jgi:hypothetical protein
MAHRWPRRLNSFQVDVLTAFERMVSRELLSGKLRGCENDIAKANSQISDVEGQRSAIRKQQSVSPDELRRLIDQLQETEGPHAFPQRTMLADRLRQIISDLRLDARYQAATKTSWSAHGSGRERSRRAPAYSRNDRTNQP